MVHGTVCHPGVGRQRKRPEGERHHETLEQLVAKHHDEMY